MEAALSIVFNKPAVELSAQMVTNCTSSYSIAGAMFMADNGCQMGAAADAITFMSFYTLPLVSGSEVYRCVDWVCSL